jgi:plasmid stability protein
MRPARRAGNSGAAHRDPNMRRRDSRGRAKSGILPVEPAKEARMPDLVLHDIPEEELAALESRGARHGRSVEAEAKHLLHEAATEERLLAELERAAQAVDAKLRDTAAVSGDRSAAPPRPRPRRFEPTPRRR